MRRAAQLAFTGLFDNLGYDAIKKSLVTEDKSVQGQALPLLEKAREVRICTAWPRRRGCAPFVDTPLRPKAIQRGIPGQAAQQGAKPATAAPTDASLGASGIGARPIAVAPTDSAAATKYALTFGFFCALLLSGLTRRVGHRRAPLPM